MIKGTTAAGCSGPLRQKKCKWAFNIFRLGAKFINVEICPKLPSNFSFQYDPQPKMCKIVIWINKYTLSCHRLVCTSADCQAKTYYLRDTLIYGISVTEYPATVLFANLPKNWPFTEGFLMKKFTLTWRDKKRRFRPVDYF